METFFIILHQSHKPENGYNMTMGGEGSYGWTPSKETKALWSKQRRGRPASGQQLANLTVGRRWMASPEGRKAVSEISRLVWQRPERRTGLEARTQASFKRALTEYLRNPVKCEVCSKIVAPLPHRVDKKWVSRLRNRKHCSRVCANKVKNYATLLKKEKAAAAAA